MFVENKNAINENIFYRSNNNSLILLNIETLPNIYQKKLLNFLENKKFFEDLDIKLNHKIITITEKNLEIEIEKGNFIKRLYDRISTDFIKFKPLYDRRDDILPILDKVDVVLVMSVEPGFGGQGYIPESSEKIASIKSFLIENCLDRVLIEVDGGIKLHNAKHVLEAGADVLVAGSEVFKSNDPVQTIKDFYKLSN